MPLPTALSSARLRLRLVLVLAAGVLLLLPTAPCVSALQPSRARFIVQLKPGTAVSAARQRIDTVLSGFVGASIVRAIECGETGFVVVAGCDDVVCAPAVSALADLVALVEADGVMSLDSDAQTPPPPPPPAQIQEVLRDSWSLDAVSKPESVEQQNGLYEYDYTGTGVNVYLLDTGIRLNHTEFGGRARTMVSLTGEVPECDDCNGHGTHVAGSVGGKTFGVAKNVTLHSVQVLGVNGSAFTSTVVEGVCYVGAFGVRPAVLVLSLGGFKSQPLDNAIREVYNQGFYSAVAAGNSADNACDYSPAKALFAVTVGNHDRDGVKASTSNYGACVKVWAPGERIRSAYIESETSTTVMSGTSMAAPHVGGAMALMLEQNPWASFSQILTSLQEQSKTQKLYDANNTIFQDGRVPILNSRATVTPCLGHCRTTLAFINGSEVDIATAHFVLQDKGNVTLWVYSRIAEADPAQSYLSTLVEAFNSTLGRWHAVSSQFEGDTGESDTTLVLTFEGAAVGEEHRVRVIRANPSTALEIRVLLSVPLSCSAGTTCNNAGRCSSNGDQDGEVDPTSTALHCQCFTGYDGSNCEVNLTAKLNNLAMVILFAIGFALTTVGVARSVAAKRQPPATRVTIVNESTPLINDQQRPQPPYEKAFYIGASNV